MPGSQMRVAKRAEAAFSAIFLVVPSPGRNPRWLRVAWRYCRSAAFLNVGIPTGKDLVRRPAPADDVSAVLCTVLWYSTGMSASLSLALV
ncbi:hypothetical protein CONLIGDRAFT_629940 [Coniochaeta ligniaria NRRL 30616]|uniref:Uncharacterized protein n=1 Tax=Coniochaeta ligniaria NRRL 30616 TaxID=1408157 RepID=A0A1J7IYK4_9PEZI|nr:hypothetical protein CONLIGDRAFT_629940 [Coniochaeta ligniaria NRRL 30616]